MFISCNDEDNKKARFIQPPEKVILNAKSEVEGDLKDDIMVVNEKYEITIDTNRSTLGDTEYRYKLPLKIKFINEQNVPAGTGYNRYGPSLDAQLLDKEGKPIFDGSWMSSSTDMEKISTYLSESDREEWITFRGSPYLSGKPKEVEQQAKEFLDKISQAAKVRVQSEVIAEKQDPDEDKSESSSEEVQSTGSSDGDATASANCQQFLDEYEDFMDDYIEVVKEYEENPSDPGILQDYQRLSQKASNFTKPDDCASDPDFLSEYQRIQQKIARAASGL